MRDVVQKVSNLYVLMMDRILKTLSIDMASKLLKKQRRLLGLDKNNGCLEMAMERHLDIYDSQVLNDKSDLEGSEMQIKPAWVYLSGWKA